MPQNKNSELAELPWTAIARTGTFSDSNGREHTFTSQDLAAIAHNYQAMDTQAPLVIGHVENDSVPAYGWVKSLKAENTKLFAQFSCVSDKVKILVQNEFYKNVSMSVDADKKRLLHVALLGAVAPAIDGLGSINLSVGDEISINFSAENSQENNKQVNKQKSEGIMNLEELQKKVEALMAENASLKAKLAKKDGEKNESDKKTEDAKAEFSAFKNSINAEKRETRVQALVDSGKLEPAKKDEVLAFANQLAASPASFSLGTQSMSMEEKYLSEFEERKPSDMFASFSASPKHTVNSQAPAVDYDPDDILAKL